MKAFHPEITAMCFKRGKWILICWDRRLLQCITHRAGWTPVCGAAVAVAVGGSARADVWMRDYKQNDRAVISCSFSGDRAEGADVAHWCAALKGHVASFHLCVRLKLTVADAETDERRGLPQYLSWFIHSERTSAGRRRGVLCWLMWGRTILFWGTRKLCYVYYIHNDGRRNMPTCLCRLALPAPYWRHRPGVVSSLLVNSTEASQYKLSASTKINCVKVRINNRSGVWSYLSATNSSS